MNLTDYVKLDTGNTGHSSGPADYVKFEKTGDTKFLRFMYESGGENMGSDINFRRKKWDDAAKKFIYDTDDGQLICALDCIEYDEDGSNPRRVKWERSAYFCKNTLLPMWKNYPRIIDGVWKVSVTNPKTMDATYSLFPVMNADTIKFPIIEAPKSSDNNQAQPAPAQPAPAQPAEPQQRKKYWE